MENVKHSTKSVEWYTPYHIIEAAKATLGQIDLDPATTVEMNASIQASHIFTKETDGLNSEWPADVSIFLNPPGGKVGNKSLAGLFWQKLMKHREDGKLKHAIFVCFSLEAAQTTQGKGCPSVLEFSFCIPAKRISFIGENAEAQSPSHANAIIYVPGTEDYTHKFVRAFDYLGLTRRR